MNTPLDDAKKGKFTDIILLLKKYGGKSKIDEIGKLAAKKIIRQCKDDREFKLNPYSHKKIIEENDNEEY
jgi:hypothetical protein